MSDGVQGGNGEKNAPQNMVEEVAQRLATDIGGGAMDVATNGMAATASEAVGVTEINTVELNDAVSDSRAAPETSPAKIVDRRPEIDLADTCSEHVMQPDNLAADVVELCTASPNPLCLSPICDTTTLDTLAESSGATETDARSSADAAKLKPVEHEPVGIEPVNSSATGPANEQPAKRGEAPKLRTVPDLRTDVFTTPTLFHFASSVGVTRVLERLVENALASNRPLDHVLLHGPPGCGTTLVARAIVRDLAPKNFVELDLLDGVDQEMLRRAVREVRNQGVLLIRHIELMSSGDEQFLMSCIARKTTRGTGSFARDTGVPTTPAKRRKQSIDEFQVDATPRRSPPSFPRIDGNFTLIATAHLTQQIGYQLRHRFDHMIHLRSDAVGVRIAITRVLTRHGFVVDESAHAPIERFTRTIDDVAEQFVRALVMRAQLDETARIDGTLVRSVVTEDMPARIADEVYGWALTRHLAGRRVTAVTDNEVERIDTETGWGEVAVRAALGVVVRNAAARAVPPAA
jgi:Holliday junction resolvasome RuvABC ATP-dependent DNA helicase subunit